MRARRADARRGLLAAVRSIAATPLRASSTARMLVETRSTQTPVAFSSWLRQQLVPSLRHVYWPIHPTSVIQNPRKVVLGVETSPGLMPGCYVQGLGGVLIGDYTQIGPHVGIHSNNHDVYQNQVDVPKPVRIGAYCWLGMGSQILSGVELGDFTIVGAGSIVTKSFVDGHCVIAGNPARVLRQLDVSKCVRYESKFPYHGFVPAADFARFRRDVLLF